MNVVKYFNAERIQCSIGIVLSLIAIALAVYFLIKINKPFYNGMAYPMIIVSVLLTIVCATVIFRVSADTTRVMGLVTANPAGIASEEIPRMKSVIRTFQILIGVEIVLIVAGALLYFFLTRGSAWQGVGVGLSVMAIGLLIFDTIANNRAKGYLAFLESV